MVSSGPAWHQCRGGRTAPGGTLPACLDEYHQSTSRFHAGAGGIWTAGDLEVATMGRCVALGGGGVEFVVENPLFPILEN